MNSRIFMLLGSTGLLLQGCAGLSGLSSDSMKHLASPQEVIQQKNLNAGNGAAREYVYDWGTKQGQLEPQALYPRKHLGNYCHDKEGKFSLLYKSNMSLVKDAAQKKRLLANSLVRQGIGAYQCRLETGSWVVSIEPVAEAKQSGSNARTVSLQTTVMSLDEAKRFYRNAVQQSTATQDKKATSPTVKTANTKTATTKEKETEDKKETKTAELPEKQPERVAETPQQQQLKAYVAARRDLSKGQNQVNACNNAQRAYNFGKLPGTSANVYVDSGMLVARCLTGISAYSNRFPNAKAQATRILQNLSSNYNHAGAKQMLKTLK